MNDLSERMQERLDKWRKRTGSQEMKKQSKPTFMRAGKNDYGDVMTEEEWGREVILSQKRR